MGRRRFAMSINFILLFLSSASLNGVNGSTRCEREFKEFKRECESYQIRTTTALQQLSQGIQLCQAAARFETELRQQRDAKSALESELRQERDAKSALEAQLRQERDAKVELETQLSQEQDAKAAMETELRQERDATDVLGTQLRQERDAKTELELQLRQEGAKARKAKDLITVMVTALATEKHEASVPRPAVYGKVNGSVELSCESGNQPLSLCVWEGTVKGQGEIVIVDQAVIKNGGATSVDGIYSTTNGFQNGKCTLKVHRLKRNDFGSWSCTLVTNSGRAHGGILTVDENKPPSLYFGTDGGVKRYSLEDNQVKRVANSSERAFGVVFDWLRDKIYWTGEYQAFQANRDGIEVEAVLDTRQYGVIRDGGLFGLALDWVTGNIYVASRLGFISACDLKRITGSAACVQVLKGQGVLQGIALDPVAGTMYWTKYVSSSSSTSSIWRSELDGTNPVTLVPGLKDPHGIAIDFSSQRLYWVDKDANKIQSSDLQGQNIQTVFQVSDGLDRHPYGVAVVGNRIYWSTHGLNRLQSGSKAGGQITTHYNGTSYLRQLAVVPSIDLPQNRTNHCAGRRCAMICVLTATSSRCLDL